MPSLNLCRLTVLAASSVAALISFAAGAPVYPTMPAGDMYWYDMSLGSNLKMLVQVAGSTPTVVAFPGSSVRYRDWKGVTLQMTGSRLHGSQWVHNGNSNYQIEIDVTLSGATISGTFTQKLSAAVDAGTGQVSAGTDISGAVTGTVRIESDLRASNAISPEYTWDSYAGTNQNFSSGVTGVTLHDDFRNAKLAWVSEFIGCMEIADCRHGCRMYKGTLGGAATPLIYNGKIYQLHTYPSGSTIQQCFVDAMTDATRAFISNTGQTEAEGMRHFSLHADDIMTCIDAATGKTLWQTRFPEEGINAIGHKNALTNHTGCAGDGRVYMFGTRGILRAMNAAGGQVLWTKNISGYYNAMTGIYEGTQGPRSRTYCHGLNYVGGVVVAPTGISTCSVIGYDGATGDSLWRGGELGHASTPVRWTHQGKEYVITTGENNTCCIDPTNGNVIWKGEAIAGDGHQCTMENDLILGYYGCFRVTLRGLEKLWALDILTCPRPSRPTGILYNGVAWVRCAGGVVAREAASGRILVTESASEGAEAMTMATEGHLMVNREAQHGNTPFDLFHADPYDFKALCTNWAPPYVASLNYAIPFQYPAANGRIFMRSADALHCYDLRADPKPTVTLTAPVNDHSLTTAEKVTLKATVAGGTVARLVFAVDGQEVTSDATAPYEFEWGALDRGAHYLSATAIDGSGYAAHSNGVRVWVSQAACASAPQAVTSPVPANGAQNVQVFSGLEWGAVALGVNLATSYIVKMGTAANPPPIDTVEGITSLSTWTGQLRGNTTYHWRVDAVNSCGVTAGPEWTFTTKGFDGYRCLRADFYGQDDGFNEDVHYLEWLVGTDKHPQTALYGSSGDGMTVTQHRGEGDAWKLYDTGMGHDAGWSFTYFASATLDLGAGRAIIPTQARLGSDGNRHVSTMSLLGSEDGTNWVVLYDGEWRAGATSVTVDLTPVRMDEPLVPVAAPAARPAARVRAGVNARVHRSRLYLGFHRAAGRTVCVELFDMQGRCVGNTSSRSGDAVLDVGHHLGTRSLVWRITGAGIARTGVVSAAELPNRQSVR